MCKTDLHLTHQGLEAHRKCIIRAMDLPSLVYPQQLMDRIQHVLEEVPMGEDSPEHLGSRIWGIF